MNRSYLKPYRGKNFPTQTSKIGAEMKQFKPRPRPRPNRRPRPPVYPEPGTYVA